MPRQLGLDLRLRDSASFDNFHATADREALEGVRAAPEAGATVFLWGEPGSGKTHLLQAACRAAQARGRSVLYVPAAEAAGLDAALLEGADALDLVCVDDVQALSGNDAWERALFAACERRRAVKRALLLSADIAPAQLPLRLADLKSRLGGALVYRLKGLDDGGKVAAMQLRARNRGFELPDDVTKYVLSRYRRDTGSLFALLDRIDAQSLAAQRRVTVPFIRSLEE